MKISKSKNKTLESGFKQEFMNGYWVAYDKSLSKKITSVDNEFIIEGQIDYFLVDGAVKYLKDLSEIQLENLLHEFAFEKSDCIQGRFTLCAVDLADKKIFLTTDPAGRKEIFYSQADLRAGSNLDGFNVKQQALDRVALAQVLAVHGSYCAKSMTVFESIKRLDPSEKLIFDNEKIKIKSYSPEFKKINSECDLLESYYTAYKTVMQEISENEVWIFMSSGWDSSSILAMLKHVGMDSRRIKPVIGRFKYSHENGVINEFEVSRAREICDYYEVELIVVDIDYTESGYNEDWERYKPIFRTNHIYSFYTYNFFKLSEYVKRNAGSDAIVVNGETSDGAHNFGFAQFATDLGHPNLSFREYADKMNSYLFGPTFFKQIEEGNYYKDSVFRFFTEIQSKKSVAAVGNWKPDFILSFLFGSDRIPFSEPSYNFLLSEAGQDLVTGRLKDYASYYAEQLNGENIYSVWLELYSRFHWQGSTVRGMQLAPECMGLKVRAPFWDHRIITLLKQMPENFGRGLEFQPTKYPLKWVLSKIGYPDVLQSGPHSYLYDVDPSWSADYDIMTGSARVPHFKNLIKSRCANDLLEMDIFDRTKIKTLFDSYVNEEKLSVSDFKILSRIVSYLNIVED